MKWNDDSVEFTLEEFGEFTGTKWCNTCATMLPLWEWAKRKSTCPECKARPSQEDIDGIRRDHTPADWKPKRQQSGNVVGAKLTAFLNMQTLKDRPAIGAQIIQDAAKMIGFEIEDVKVDDKGVYSAVVKCKCGQKNRVKLLIDRIAHCGKCKEAL